MGNETLYKLIELGSQKLTIVKELSFEAETIPKEDKLEIFFKNIKIKRVIKFVFRPYAPKGNNLFIVFFYRLPSITANDGFTLVEYVDNKRINIDCNYTTLEGYEGTIEERIEAYFKCIDNIFNTYLKDIISGKTWEIIPVDWGPYK
jgi:hypothetical protein